MPTSMREQRIPTLAFPHTFLPSHLPTSTPAARWFPHLPSFTPSSLPHLPPGGFQPLAPRTNLLHGEVEARRVLRRDVDSLRQHVKLRTRPGEAMQSRCSQPACEAGGSPQKVPTAIVALQKFKLAGWGRESQIRSHAGSGVCLQGGEEERHRARRLFTVHAASSTGIRVV